MNESNLSRGVTVVVTRRPKPGCEAPFEEYIKGITHCAMQHPGHLGVNVFKPQSPAGEYRIIFKFDSQENLDRWESSEARNKWRKVAEEVSEPHTIEVLSGLEAWLVLPGEEQPAPTHPPKYKMALVVWMSIYTLVITLSHLFGFLLNPLPFELRILILTCCVVILMTYLVVPFLTKLLRPWLFKA